jgi:hypothetical protein
VVEDCYWKHGSTRAQRYICLDHQHEVCSRCCVECCPVETPEWFSECTLAGHPTWPSASHAIPMKLVCLESSWEKRVFHNTSVKGFFESLGPLTHPPLHVAHRYVESSRHLAHYTRKPDGLLWTDANAWDAPIFYLAFHGSPGRWKPCSSELILVRSVRRSVIMEITLASYILVPAVSSQGQRVKHLATIW